MRRLLWYEKMKLNEKEEENKILNVNLTETEVEEIWYY